ncbi:MAG: hypothetical protein KF795_09870 [Labilithrix sp.]|nr:hypothetical protein [Labilithrix sp.]
MNYDDPTAPERSRSRPAECFVGKTVVTNVDPSAPLRVHPASTEIADCASAIEMPCICHRVEGCFKQKMCSAPLVAQVTRDERARRAGACCFAAPRECAHPGKGRALRVEGSLRVAPSQRRSDCSMVAPCVHALRIALSGAAA